MVVVFQAPFGPRKPKTSPEWRVSEISERISDFQIVLERFLRDITVCISLFLKVLQIFVIPTIGGICLSVLSQSRYFVPQYDKK
jgi:hypothetical protein